MIPAVLVVVLAALGPVWAPDRECESTDGPQFKCWLEDQR